MFTNAVKEIDAPELALWVKSSSQDIRIIDVRQMDEISSGTVPKAEALPLHILPTRLADIPKNSKLVMVCRSGARSAQACLFLQQQGYSDVYNLRGGMIGWVRCGFPPSPLS
jgi:rhodanese-related sulfurtransferase